MPNNCCNIYSNVFVLAMLLLFYFFFFNDTATTEIYTLSLHDALPISYAHPQRWMFGEDSKIYNYDLFDPEQNMFGGLSVLELDPVDFHVRRRIFATRARWSEARQVWALESGWIRDFRDGSVTKFEPFAAAAP